MVTAAFVTKRTSAKSWAKKKFGTFKTKTYHGVGDDVITLPKGLKTAAVTAKHVGESNFILVAMTKSGSWDEVLVNEIGDYRGMTPLGLETPTRARVIEVTADGPWTITVRPVSSAPKAKLKKSYVGDQVLLYDVRSTKVRTFRHNGAGSFDVWYSNRSTAELLISRMGDYKGRKFVKAGPGLLVVSADGAWSVS